MSRLDVWVLFWSLLLVVHEGAWMFGCWLLSGMCLVTRLDL